MMAGSSLFDTLKNGLRQVNIEGETYFITEGDMLLDENQLEIYAMQHEALNVAREAGRAASARGFGLVGMIEAPTDALVGITQGGKVIRWKPGLVLSYRVVRETFANQANYDLVVQNARAATRAWEETCGVQFEHRSNLDTVAGTQPSGALFTVRQIDAGGQFIAAAFFPNDPASRRRVLIDPSYFSAGLTFDKVGVLRHELGHVLGFRHEHIRSGAPAVCPDESLGNTINLSDYDPKSVMHYFCGGVGTRELLISDVDRTGSQKVYGPSLASFSMME